jgi:hypothetical protein
MGALAAGSEDSVAVQAAAVAQAAAFRKEREHSMAKIVNPREIFSDITAAYQGAFGDDLVSIILYGSAAGRDYRPGKSDINFLVVLSERAIGTLDAAIPIVARWRKRSVAVPLVMTKQYISSSLDSYPLEFLSMMRSYTVVHGADVLAGLAVEPRNLRLQCEREIKGKLLLLRVGYLEAEGKPKRVQELMASSTTAFISIMSGLLHLKGLDIPGTRRDLINLAADRFTLDPWAFNACLDMRERKKKFSGNEVKALFKSYLAEINKLWEIIDIMDV